MAGRSEDASGGQGFFKGLVEKASDLQTSKAIGAQTQQVTAAVGGHVREVLGPLSEASDLMKQTFTNAKDFFQGMSEDVAGILGFAVGENKWETKMRKQGAEQVDEIEKTNMLLVIGLKMQKKERLARMRDVSKKASDTWFGLIMAIPALLLGIIAGFIGARAKMIVAPFVFAFDALRLIGGSIKNFVKTIFGFFSKEGRVGKSMKQLELFAKEGWITKLIKFFKEGKLFKTISTVFTSIAKNRWITGLTKTAKFVFGGLGKFLGYLAKLPLVKHAFRIGKTIGGKFLAPLIAIIDFFVGLSKYKDIFGKEAGLREAIISGVAGIISGLFKLPAMAVDWLIKKITGIETDFANIFSVESIALAIDGFFMFVKDAIDGVVNFFAKVRDAIFGKDFSFSAEWEAIKAIPGKIIDDIGKMFDSIGNFFGSIWGWIQEKIVQPIRDFLKAHPYIASAVSAFSPAVGLLAAATGPAGGAPEAGATPEARQMIRKPIERAEQIREFERKRALLQMQSTSPRLPEEMKQHATDQLQKLEHILIELKKGGAGAVPVIVPGQGQTAQSMEPREDPPGAGMAVMNEAW